MFGNAHGGNDTLTGGESQNTLVGDAQEMGDNAWGGNDVLISGTGTDFMWGDAQIIDGVQASPAASNGNVHTGADTFVFAPGNGNDFIGDFRQSDGDQIDVSAYGFSSLADMMITFDGANIRIAFDANDSVTLVGFTDLAALRPSDFVVAELVPNTQTGSLTDDQRGTNDAFVGFTFLFGDAFEMHEDSRGGNDTLEGADYSPQNKLYGDASLMEGNSRGGNDVLTGGEFSNSNTLYGDAALMTGNARGGNDTLTGGQFSNVDTLVGDADRMFGSARGGDDTLTGGDGAPTNFLFGDAFVLSGNARGGDDILISGTGTDHMWGDGGVSPTGTVQTGADTFVFAPGNGNDDINDFRQSDGDRIDVSAWGFQTLTQMMITEVGGDTRIGFDANNSVTLVGFSDPSALRASDFTLA
jgi:Ca2+-binding RTX toxin-like protein